MLDFFSIFSKGGIVLWCFQGAGVSESFTGPVNALIRSVILQVKPQTARVLLCPVEINLKLPVETELCIIIYMMCLFCREAEVSSKAKAPASMRNFNESEKSKKTVKSMIETKDGDKSKEQGGKKSKNAKKEAESGGDQAKAASQTASKKAVENGNEGLTQEEIIERNRAKFISKQLGGGKAEKPSKSPKPQKPKGKANRVWDMSGKSIGELDYSGTNGNNSSDAQNQDPDATAEPLIQVDSMKGDLRGVDYESSDDDEDEVVQEEERVVVANTKKGAKKGGFGGMFGMLKGLVGSKNLTQEDMEPVLDKMRDHLIAKNVAAEIASQLCNSVAKKLEGKVMGTFTTVASTVKQALQDSLVQILQPKRRVDILRDVLEARSQRKPFVITFCGVNGVGKSTNLAKISYWLIENGFTVLIAACDTFRAGAVEQLRTHQRRLNSLHPLEKHGGQPAVQLFEKGYGKDAAGIAMEAIAFARNQVFDVVLIDTAGRMQDNAPLMTALAKLIAVNTPDLVLFVGEALVGNEAVDQLVKFNQALADHSKTDKPRLIDGIVLTKFDTIDDKVGAAISMTYITGQPIVFVGTGQTYSDLRSLNARAVVSALMKA
uniref:Signal recognition particle receptor subunit alpha-like n=2 Tax=Sinocyclocheilus rhinocerous TaxID=307959 RepID=A0A673MV34_9TELE